MSFSHTAGIAIVPTLARLVLAAAFITSGWNKLMTQQEFTGEEGQRLKELLRLAGSSSPNTPSIQLASLRHEVLVHETAQDPGGAPKQDEPPPDPEPDGIPPDADETPSDTGDKIEDAAEEIKEGVQDAVDDLPKPPKDVIVTPPGSDQEVVKVKRMHAVTLLVDQKGWPQPTLFAWAATLTELVGGSMLLIGLFSRLWGLVLAVAMCIAFYLTSLPHLQFHGFSLFALNVPEFNRLFFQAGFFVLAFGIFLTGPGPISLDRLLFRPSPRPIDDDDR